MIEVNLLLDKRILHWIYYLYWIYLLLDPMGEVNMSTDYGWFFRPVVTEVNLWPVFHNEDDEKAQSRIRWLLDPKGIYDREETKDLHAQELPLEGV